MPSPTPENPPHDHRLRVWNARGIAVAADLYDPETGEPDEARVHYLIQRGYLKHSIHKVGRQWTGYADEINAELNGEFTAA